MSRCLTPKMIALCACFMAVTLAASSGVARNATVETKEGPFSLAPFIGYGWARVLNENGSFSGFSGLDAGARLTVRLLGESAGRFDLFAQASMLDAVGSVPSDKMRHQESFFGGQISVLTWFFLAGGYGLGSTVIDTGQHTTSFQNSFLGAGGGFDFPSMGDFELSLQFWYKAGFASKQTNTSLSANSGLESAEVVLALSWSPPSLTISSSR